MVSPPTPPLTESDVQRLPKAQIAHSSASTSLIDATSTIYQDMFPTISSLAIQNCHLELIDLAETTELTVDRRSRADQSRLLLVAPLVLSYISINDLAQSRIALSRLPDSLASHALPQSLAKLIAALKYRNYPLIYKRIDEVSVTVQGNFFSPSLGTVVKILLGQLTHEFHCKTTELVTKVYSSLPLPLAATYFNVSEDVACKTLQQLGWTYNSSTDQLSPPPLGKPLCADRSASSLFTAKELIDATSQIEFSI